MENLPQLHMRKTDMDNIPNMPIPNGLSIHTHHPGQEKNWEALVKKAFGMEFSFNRLFTDATDYVGGYDPSHTFYVEKDGKDIATATGMEKDTFKGEGWFRMVGTDPDERGHGAGKLVCIAVLESLAKRGYKSVALSTDDERLPAISMYLSLGFKPLYLHPKDKERWDAVLSKINSKLK